MSSYPGDKISAGKILFTIYVNHIPTLNALYLNTSKQMTRKYWKPKRLSIITWCASMRSGTGGPVWLILKAHPRQKQKKQGLASCVVEERGYLNLKQFYKPFVDIVPSWCPMFLQGLMQRPDCPNTWFSHAVHGVVWHQSACKDASHLCRYAGRRKHVSDVRGGVHILPVLHLVRQSLPVNMETSDTRVGGQNVPLELRDRKYQGILQ